MERDAPGLNHQIVSSPIPVEKNTDYLLRIPIRVEQGSVVLDITNTDDTQRYGSTPVLNPLERIKPTDQSLDVHEVAFVTREADQISLFLESADRRGGKTVVRLGELELFRLGPASLLWTRYIRFLLHHAQRFFITAWILPLAIFGLALMLLSGRVRDIIVLLAIPAYYVCVQSFLHTEYRYVLAAQPFLYVMVGVRFVSCGLPFTGFSVESWLTNHAERSHSHRGFSPVSSVVSIAKPFQRFFGGNRSTRNRWKRFKDRCFSSLITGLKPRCESRSLRVVQRYEPAGLIPVNVLTCITISA